MKDLLERVENYIVITVWNLLYNTGDEWFDKSSVPIKFLYMFGVVAFIILVMIAPSLIDIAVDSFLGIE